MNQSTILASVLILAVSVGLACTHARIAPSGSESASRYYTAGVAQVTHCKEGSNLTFKFDQTRSDNSTDEVNDTQSMDLREVQMTCTEAVHMESSGFTGWDMLDAAFTGFISYITFGAVTF